ncbi:nitroreductase [Streptomyces sp. 3330]|uniref:Acg family FMN-binding oxidoreductase n=1 Tax=Streptomyces sp. 3330 TaxID=2817755 RepID=UPI0028589EC0|nr:nitroreductase family protein [Streptomyces sp. 3330]MDR6975926.1 nitroreductase [Streptomyces sp. 3330]
MESTTFGAALLETCVSAAVAAPSIHNTQPWRFGLDPATVTFEVRADPARSMPHVDPTGRALLLSVGACVFNLRVALAHFGWSPVTRLLPDPDDPGLLATVRPADPTARRREEGSVDLYEAVWRRHSSRLPFAGRSLPAAVRDELAAVARAEGTSLRFCDGAEATRVLRLTAEAERRNRLDADRAAESRRRVHRVLEPPPGTGLPRTALGPQDARERIPLRDFTAQRHPERLVARPFEASPVLALLATEHDRRVDWLRTGQALERVWLVATVYGVRGSVMHQAVEWADLRDALGGPPEGTAHPQLLMRLGYGPEGPATPRRTPGRDPRPAARAGTPPPSRPSPPSRPGAPS